MSELSELASPTAYTLESQSTQPDGRLLDASLWRAFGAPLVGIDYSPERPILSPEDEIAALRAELAVAREETAIAQEDTAIARSETAAANARTIEVNLELRKTQAQLRASENRNNLLLDQLTEVRGALRKLNLAHLEVKLELAWTKAELEEVLGKFSEALAISERLEYATKTDALTALDNRPSLAEKFDAHNGWSFGFVTDLDHFKLANDLLGHPVGDKILEKIGLEFCHSVRDQDTDIVGRLGGDEYMGVIALPTPDPERKEEQDMSSEDLAQRLEKEIPARISRNVRSCLKKLCQDLSQEPEFKDNPKRLLYLALVFSKLDVSIGTARYVPGMSFEELYFHADNKMLEVKKARHATDRRLVIDEATELAPPESEARV